MKMISQWTNICYNKDMVKSAYIHIPFCKSKCHYCSFVSYPDMSLKQEYLQALNAEIYMAYKEEILDTLYIGGGTPSILEIEEVENIIKCFNINKNTEITMELNPDDVDYGYLRNLYDIGINRLSFGCQTFNDEILGLINRRHNAGQVIDAVKMAQDAGFKNISLDFIYGLPNQTIDMFHNDLKLAVLLDVTHISLYGLTIEPGCYFYEQGCFEPDEDIQADMYLGAVQMLKDADFEHYEISNFSKKGFNSRHNLNYWNNEEYYGFGVAAHGYVGGIRYGNKVELDDYINNPYEHSEENIVTSKEQLEEEIFLGFRKTSGINIADINMKYGIKFESQYNSILQKYSDLGLIKRTKEGYSLTPRGILVSNTILSEFIE